MPAIVPRLWLMTISLMFMLPVTISTMTITKPIAIS